MRLTDVLELAAERGARRHCEKRAGVLLPLTVGAMIPGIVQKSLERARATEHALDGAPAPLKQAASGPSFFASGNGPPTPAYAPTHSTQTRAMPSFGGGGQSAGLGPTAALLAGLLGGPNTARLAGGAASAAGALGIGDIAAAPGKGVAHGLTDLVQKKLFGQDIGERRDAFGMAGGAALSAFGKEMGSTGANLLRDIANKAMEAVGNRGDNAARQAIIGELKRTDSVLAQADDALLMESYHTMTRFAPTLSTDKNAVRSFLRQAVMSGSGPDFMTIKHLADSERAITGGKDAR